MFITAWPTTDDVVIGHVDGVLEVLSLSEGSLVGKSSWHGHERGIVALSWKDDLLCSVSVDGTVRFWRDGALKREFVLPFSPVLKVHRNPDGDLTLWQKDGNCAVVLSLKRNQVIELPGPSLHAASCGDGDTFGFLTRPNEVVLLNAKSGSTRRINLDIEVSGWLFLLDGRSAILSREGALYWIDLDKGDVAYSLTLNEWSDSFRVSESGGLELVQRLPAIPMTVADADTTLSRICVGYSRGCSIIEGRVLSDRKTIEIDLYRDSNERSAIVQMKQVALLGHRVAMVTPKVGILWQPANDTQVLIPSRIVG